MISMSNYMKTNTEEIELLKQKEAAAWKANIAASWIASRDPGNLELKNASREAYWAWHTARLNLSALINISESVEDES